MEYDEDDLHSVPDLIKQFVVYFYRHIREKNVYEILTMYDFTWAKLSDQFFKSSPWPLAEVISPLANDDHVFLLLYREMYFRHLYARSVPSLAQQAASWENYRSLLGLILHGSVNMQLPVKWLWDMVDELIYQYQAYCAFRGKLSAKGPEELAALRACEDEGVWSTLAVLGYLQALVDKSGIDGVLAREAAGKERFAETDGYEPDRSNVLKMLGYFSKLGLLRVHVLLGDYATGLKALEPVDPRQPGAMFTKVVGSYVTALTHVGFAQLMSGRYAEAIRSFNAILAALVRAKAALARAPQADLVAKRTEQLFALLALALALSPQVKLVDEVVLAATRDKHGEKMARVARGEETPADELFTYACPKFVNPARPDFEAAAAVDNANQEAYRAQLRLFLGEVRALAPLSALRAVLRLYTTIPVAKLAALVEAPDAAALHQQLAALKQKQRGNALAGAAALEAAGGAAEDLDFYVEGDMVHVMDTKVVRQHGESGGGSLSLSLSPLPLLRAAAPRADDCTHTHTHTHTHTPLAPSLTCPCGVNR